MAHITPEYPAMMNETPRPTADDLAAVARCKARYDCVSAELGNVILGQRDAIEQVLIAVRARGHALLEGPPALGSVNNFAAEDLRTVCGTFMELGDTPEITGGFGSYLQD